MKVNKLMMIIVDKGASLREFPSLMFLLQSKSHCKFFLVEDSKAKRLIVRVSKSKFQSLVRVLKVKVSQHKFPSFYKVAPSFQGPFWCIQRMKAASVSWEFPHPLTHTQMHNQSRKLLHPNRCKDPHAYTHMHMYTFTYTLTHWNSYTHIHTHTLHIQLHTDIHTEVHLYRWPCDKQPLFQNTK